MESVPGEEAACHCTVHARPQPGSVTELGPARAGHWPGERGWPCWPRNVMPAMARRGIEVTHEAIRQWCWKFGQDYANQLKHRRAQPGDKWHLEIVFTQLTKTRGFTTGSRWDSVPDFDIAIGDQDPVDQEFDQGPLLLECGLS